MDAERREGWLWAAAYAIGIAANLWLVWDQYRDTDQAQELKTRAVRVLDRLREPGRRARAFKQARNRMLFDAHSTVVDAQRARDQGNDDGAEPTR
jgi:hypothetical protein